MGIADDFAKAQVDVKTLTKRPSNDDLLFLYTHFKQGTVGDVTGKRPGMLDPVARAKYDAWAKLKGMSSEDAMREYAAKVSALLQAE